MLLSVNVLAQNTNLNEYEKKEQEISQEYDLKSQKITESKDLLLASLMIEKKFKILNLWKPVYSEIQEAINKIRISKRMSVVLKKGEILSGGYDIIRELIMEIENKRPVNTQQR